MKVRSKYLILCEKAIQGNDSKVSLINVFDEVTAKSLPIAYGPLSLVGQLIVEDTNKSKVKLNVEFELFDPAGNSHPNKEKNATMEVNIKDGIGQVGMIISVPALVFETEGFYRFVTKIDGKIIAETSIRGRLV